MVSGFHIITATAEFMSVLLDQAGMLEEIPEEDRDTYVPRVIILVNPDEFDKKNIITP